MADNEKSERKEKEKEQQQQDAEAVDMIVSYCLMF
jgi:hypothetical protein